MHMKITTCLLAVLLLVETDALFASQHGTTVTQSSPEEPVIVKLDSTSRVSVTDNGIDHFLNWNSVIAIIALILSTWSLYLNYFAKGKPIFVCSQWFVVRSGTMSISQPLPDFPLFAVQISVYNEGKVPVRVSDLLLSTLVDGQKAFYRPITFFDKMTGKPRGGHVPLPIVVSPGHVYDFENPIVFFPIDLQKRLNQNKVDRVALELYARTDRSKKYVVKAKQLIESANLSTIKSVDSCSVASTESSLPRAIFLRTFETR
jgi:hypothetical protein